MRLAIRWRARSVGQRSRRGDRAGVGWLDAGEHRLELGLPVAVDAGDAEHLAGAHDRSRRRAARRAHTLCTASRTGRPSGTVDRPAPLRGAMAPTDHRIGQRDATVCSRDRRVGEHDGAVAQHGHPVAAVDHLAQPVGDDHHGTTVVGQVAAHRQQPVGLGRR